MSSSNLATPPDSASLVGIDLQALAQVADQRSSARLQSYESNKRKPGLSCARPSEAGA
jgi:hypothetical protein